MTIVTLKTNLLKKREKEQQQTDEITAGSLTFSYDDTQILSVSSQESPDEKHFFLLTSLVLQLNAGIANIEGLKNGLNLELSEELAELHLAYSKPNQFNKIGKFEAVQQLGERLFNIWNFKIVPNTVFLTDGASWGIDESTVPSMKSADVSGLLGKLEIIEPKPISRGIQIPNQFPPVSRKVIFDPNQNNADPAVAIGSDPNDPMSLIQPIACGCHVLSGNSMIVCLAACGLLSSRR